MYLLRGLYLPLPVDFAPVGYAQYQNRHLALAKLVYDPVLTLAYTPQTRELPLETGAGGRI